jgi:hypothetical protein
MATFPSKSLKCTTCRDGYYGEVKFENNEFNLVCKQQTKELVGCISVRDNKCMICANGYYMNQTETCSEMQKEDNKENDGSVMQSED